VTAPERFRGADGAAARAFAFAGSVVVDVGAFDLPQDYHQVELTPEEAERFAREILRVALAEQETSRGEGGARR